MRFDDWTTEARRSLEAWDPEPATRPGAPMARSEVDGSPAEDGASVVVELAAERRRPPVATPRRLLWVAAAAVVVVIAAMANRSADTDVVVGSHAGPTQPAAERLDPPSSAGPQFDCSAASPSGEPSDTSTDAFDAAPYVAQWSAIDIDRPHGQASTSETVKYVRGTLIESEGQDLAAVEARGASFVASLEPRWRCTVASPVVDVADPTRPGPIVDENTGIVNRLSGFCYVPDATANPDAVWGLDPSLAAALDQIVGLTEWRMILDDGGGSRAPQPGPGGPGAGPPPDPDRLWMEFTFETDPRSSGDDEDTARIEAEVAAAVDAAGDAAGVATECTAR